MKLLLRLFSLYFLLTTVLYPAQSQEFDGYALYNEFSSTTTYLIDKNADIAHSWSLERSCNYTVLLMDSGNIMRGAVKQNNQINGAAVGGLVQEIDPEGNVIWEFEYSNNNHVSHHDISLMPDGNVLLTAWEVKNSIQLDSMGYTGNNNVRYPTHFVEVSQNGTGGEIVWEWHIWDHMVQDVDSTKVNFGVVAEHPELMDINVPTAGFGGPPGSGDWFHVNGVDYNKELDLITFSSRFLSEIFVIDHSTTTAEAAGHTGGNYGKGGDFLYRWGKPSNYGAPGLQTIPGPVHDARWIPNDGRPRGGMIQFFNNDGDGFNSTVQAVEYDFNLAPGAAFAPTYASWTHITLGNAWGQSASNSMPNGNVFVSLSGGYMYEMDTTGNVVWQYNAGPPKAFRYTCDHPGIQALTNQGVIENLCDFVEGVDEIADQLIDLSPNPSKGTFNITGLTEEYRIENIEVYDLLGKLVEQFKNENSIDLQEHPEGIYFVKIRFDNGRFISKKVSLVSY